MRWPANDMSDRTILGITLGWGDGAQRHAAIAASDDIDLAVAGMAIYSAEDMSDRTVLWITRIMVTRGIERARSRGVPGIAADYGCGVRTDRQRKPLPLTRDEGTEYMTINIVDLDKAQPVALENIDPPVRVEALVRCLRKCLPEAGHRCLRIGMNMTGGGK